MLLLLQMHNGISESFVLKLGSQLYPSLRNGISQFSIGSLPEKAIIHLMGLLRNSNCIFV